MFAYIERILQANKIILCIINVFVLHMQIAIAIGPAADIRPKKVKLLSMCVSVCEWL